MNGPDDALLVAQCLEGDTSTFEQFVERYQRPIFNIALRMVHDYEDARDITQTVFVKAWEKLETYNPKYKFFSWLYRISVNESINLIKKRRGFLLAARQLLFDSPGPGQAAHHDEGRSAQLRNALMKLKPEHRAVVVLKHLSDRSYRELSEILEIPEKTVKSRLFEARRILREILSDEFNSWQ
jgi:RNA polymerase sigma-70 factor (ECF subfamily)